jgi:hypothetical protein
MKENISRACSTNRIMETDTRRAKVYVGACIVILGWMLERQRERETEGRKETEG